MLFPVVRLPLSVNSIGNPAPSVIFFLIFSHFLCFISEIKGIDRLFASETFCVKRTFVFKNTSFNILLPRKQKFYAFTGWMLYERQRISSVISDILFGDFN